MRNVVITGASSGIGEGLAVELAKRGWERIALLGRRADALDEVAKEVLAYGSRPMAIACDVRDAQSVRDAVARVEAEWGAGQGGLRPAAWCGREGTGWTSMQWYGVRPPT